jgi:hypothetical protein
VYYPGVTQAAQAEAVLLKAGEEALADIVMRRVNTVEVAGRVLGRGGPAKQAMVSLESRGEDSFGMNHEDSTDDKGAFRIKGIPPGSYVLIVYQSGEDSQVYEQTARRKIEVGGENIEALIVSLGGGSTFEGRVLVEGTDTAALQRLRVGFNPIDEDGQWAGHRMVKKDGSFEITSVQDGSYSLDVWGLEAGWYIKSARLGGEDILEKGLQLESGAPGGRLEVVVSQGSARLEGAVTVDDQPLVGAQIRITPDPETPYNRFRANAARTDQTGHFSITGLAPGTYRVIAKSRTSAGNDTLKSRPQIITISERDRKTIELKIEKPKAE